MTPVPGTLYVVATPIGNLEDLSPRAARILGSVDAIAAEDTRVSRKLLAHLGTTRPLLSLHAHSSARKVDELAERLAGGASIALVTDAGAPGVSDPGDALVAAAVARGVLVVPVPGPSAVTTAVMASGLGAHGYRFVGFLPRTAGKRKKALSALAGERAAIVAFEAPDRLAALLGAAREVFGDERRGALCRELTKLHEQIVHGTLATLCAADVPARGEVTVVFAGAPPAKRSAPETAAGESPDRTVAELLEEALGEGLSVRDAADRVAAAAGRPRRDVYRVALEVTRRREPR